jgi:hypothetical protein
MKKVALVFAAFVLSAGVAVAKDAKAPKAMSDSEMDKVVAGGTGYNPQIDPKNTYGSAGNGAGWAFGRAAGTGNDYNYGMGPK